MPRVRRGVASTSVFGKPSRKGKPFRTSGGRAAVAAVQYSQVLLCDLYSINGRAFHKRNRFAHPLFQKEWKLRPLGLLKRLSRLASRVSFSGVIQEN